MAEVINSGKVIQKPELVLEIDDFLPPGVVGVRNKTLNEAGLFEGDGTDSDATGTVIEDEDDENQPNKPGTDLPFDTLPIPTDMRIISQTTVIGADGKVTVDVVIETSDFNGITEFEARVVRDS